MKLTRRSWLCSAPFLALSARELFAGTNGGASHPATATQAARMALETSVKITATRSIGMIRETSFGSGVVIEPNGYVVTAHHVVRGADTIQLTTPENQRVNARSVCVDRGYDLALLKAEFPLPYVAAPLAETSCIGQGKEALLVGASETAACAHMVAARVGESRTVVWDGCRALLMSVKAEVSSGFSGCGCFDAADGRLLGVVVAKSTCHRCNGYFVPANRIAEILSRRAGEAKPGRARSGRPT